MSFQAIEKLEQKVSEEEFLEAVKRAANQLGFNFEENRISGKDNRYMLKNKEDSNHEWGSGGYRLNEYNLVRLNGDEVIVLQLRKYVSWWTTSDDFVDYGDKREEFVALYQNDELAKNTFEIMRGKHAQNS